MSAILWLAILCPQERKDEEEYLQEVRRINQAIDWLLDSDEELRSAGHKVLSEIGADAIPFLEQRLTQRGVIEIYKVLCELLPSTDPRWVDEKDLLPPESDAAKLPADSVDRYVYSKFCEAYQIAQKGNYPKALDLTGAILALEPKSKHADQIRKFRRYCDIRITQTTLCEAKVIPAKTVAVAGEKIEAVLRVRNLHKNAITISFGEEGQGFAVLEFAVRIPAPKGDVHEVTRSQETRFEREIAIAPGAQWEHPFLVDTGTGLETSQDLQIILVQAWMQPRKIDLGVEATSRRILFEPGTIKVVPKKYEKDLENPLAALGRSMDSGTVNDVFILALVLENDEKEKGIELLIGALRETKRAEGRGFLCQLLTYVTEQKLGPDPKKWIEWWEHRKKP